MKVVLLRVGIDSGSGGMQGPLFEDGTFEFVCIPDGFGIDERTYGNTIGRHGRPLVEYFPKSRQSKMAGQPIHIDPDFETFTYGDPTRPKARLRTLQSGDLLVFYAGLEGWGFDAPPALYIVGYFEVQVAGMADHFNEEERIRFFSGNFHVRQKAVFEQQKSELVLVKGSQNSRLLRKASLISTMGVDRAGTPIKVLAPEMKKIFGLGSR